MTKHQKQPAGVQPAQAEPPVAEDAPAEGGRPEQAPAGAWTLALLVWLIGFGSLVVYELWTGMVVPLLFRR
jgi:hypothetical protein